jgi:hypothetical protein
MVLLYLCDVCLAGTASTLLAPTMARSTHKAHPGQTAGFSWRRVLVWRWWDTASSDIVLSSWLLALFSTTQQEPDCLDAMALFLEASNNTTINGCKYAVSGGGLPFTDCQCSETKTVVEEGSCKIKVRASGHLRRLHGDPVCVNLLCW